MRLTSTLIDYLHRAFSKSPRRFLAMRLRYDGTAMRWTVADEVLMTTVSGGSGAPLSVDLSQYTISDLVYFLAQQTGYTVEYVDRSDLADLSARVLLDGSGDQNQSNGDHLYGYTSLSWAYLDAFATELVAAKQQITEMLKQLCILTANNEWLDELGDYYYVPRLPGEGDELYGPRIIAEVLRPKSNNVALEMAISQATGGLPVSVIDVQSGDYGFPDHSGVINFDGSYPYQNTVVSGSFGLFDVEFQIDLSQGIDFEPYIQRVRDLVGRLRAAGTHLRVATFTTSLDDTATAPSDQVDNLSVAIAQSDSAASPSEYDFSVFGAIDTLSETSATPAEGAYLEYTPAYTYSGLRTHGGQVLHNSGQIILETVAGVSLTSASGIPTLDDATANMLLLANGSTSADGSQVADGVL